MKAAGDYLDVLRAYVATGQRSDGSWKNLRCDVCGRVFEGFHKLNAAGDRCCPTCADPRDELQGDTPP